MTHRNNPPARKNHERIYVKVNAGFDATGYMQPTSIIWSDGRVFPIEKVSDYRPAGTIVNAPNSPYTRSDCYTVIIHGQAKHLFFERTNENFHSLVGRWFVENIT